MFGFVPGHSCNFFCALALITLGKVLVECVVLSAHAHAREGIKSSWGQGHCMSVRAGGDCICGHRASGVPVECRLGCAVCSQFFPEGGRTFTVSRGGMGRWGEVGRKEGDVAKERSRKDFVNTGEDVEGLIALRGGMGSGERRTKAGGVGEMPRGGRGGSRGRSGNKQQNIAVANESAGSGTREELEESLKIKESGSVQLEDKAGRDDADEEETNGVQAGEKVQKSSAKRKLPYANKVAGGEKLDGLEEFDKLERMLWEDPQIASFAKTLMSDPNFQV